MRILMALLALVVCPGLAAGQICDNPQDILLINDNLPAVPSGLTGAAVIQGLCEGEAMGAVFDLAGMGNPVKVKKVACGFFNAIGTNGINAIVNLRIYDGVQFVGPVPVLGPEVLDFGAATGSAIQISSHAINEVDISGLGVEITSGKMVVAWFMDTNLGSGSCALGYPTNFGTDYSLMIFAPPCFSPPQKNLIFIQSQGWRDVTAATVTGIPICGGLINAYNGNWVIRACVEPTFPPVSMSFSPSDMHSISLGFPTLVQFSFDLVNFPGLVGQQYVPVISGSLGSTIVGGMDLGIAQDFVTGLYLTDPTTKSYFDLTPPASNYVGTVPPTGVAAGIVNLPTTISLPFAVPLHFGCLLLNGPMVTGVADPATLTITP